MRTRKSITLLLFRMSCECAKELNFLSRIYGYTLLFSLAACNIGNTLGERAIILSGILCNTYPTYPQTSSTSFHIAPSFRTLSSCCYSSYSLSSFVEHNSIRRAEWRHQNISILISLLRPALLNPRA